MRIDHRLRNIGMPHNSLQGQDIAASHHEVTGEGMPQNVERLPLRQPREKPVNSFPHPLVTRSRKQPDVTPLRDLLPERL